MIILSPLPVVTSGDLITAISVKRNTILFNKKGHKHYATPKKGASQKRRTLVLNFEFFQLNSGQIILGP